jgi:hypothetical protein
VLLRRDDGPLSDGEDSGWHDYDPAETVSTQGQAPAAVVAPPAIAASVRASSATPSKGVGVRDCMWCVCASTPGPFARLGRSAHYSRPRAVHPSSASRGVQATASSSWAPTAIPAPAPLAPAVPPAPTPAAVLTPVQSPTGSPNAPAPTTGLRIAASLPAAPVAAGPPPANGSATVRRRSDSLAAVSGVSPMSAPASRCDPPLMDVCT